MPPRTCSRSANANSKLPAQLHPLLCSAAKIKDLHILLLVGMLSVVGALCHLLTRDWHQFSEAPMVRPTGFVVDVGGQDFQGHWGIRAQAITDGSRHVGSVESAATKGACVCQPFLLNSNQRIMSHTDFVFFHVLPHMSWIHMCMHARVHVCMCA